MAYLAEITSLTDELITLITSVSQSDPKFNVYRETSLRSLRHHSNLRTNQFDVQDQLDGWEERFRVQGREGLADALRARLQALEAQSDKWTPDILNFLLQLADQPAQKTELIDLELLKEPDAEPGRHMTWEEIAEEDGWGQDRAIWRSIDYGDSSDDGNLEDVTSEASGESVSTALSSTDKYMRTPEDLITEQHGGDELQKVVDSQAWRYIQPPLGHNGRPKKTPVSDFQVFREVLFMLGGHPTSMFDQDCNLVPKCQLSNVTWDTFKALITTYAELGRTLKPLRVFASVKEQMPLLQVFQDAISKQLLLFDRRLSDIQTRYIAPEQDVVVSLAGNLDELRDSFSTFSVLSSIVLQLEQQRRAYPFRYLELLFEAAGIAQAGGDGIAYTSLGTIFFDCFQVYLRPIRLWMEDGKLVKGDKTFFISQSSTDVPLKDIWNGQFQLRQTQHGVLHAPNFLHPATKRIFTTGKSVNVLKQLGRYESTKKQWTSKEPPLDFATVCSSSSELGLAPFAELFNEAFNLWIQSKHHATSATLRQVLFESCNLSKTLDSLQHIYFGADLSALDSFTAPLFGHLDALSPSWRDRFTLTELAQEAFSRHADPDRLSAHVVVVDPDPRGGGTIAARASVRAGLTAIRLTYSLNWPVQIVLSEASIEGYQRVFTFLLQLRRATSALQSQWAGRAAGIRNDDHGFYRLVGAKLLWFCNTLSTYLTSLVLAPGVAAVNEALRGAVDVDRMIEVHSAFARDMVEECCLGARLGPLRECVLDVLDLVLKLEGARRAEVVGLCGDGSPGRSRQEKGRDDGKVGDSDAEEDMVHSSVYEAERNYGETLKAIDDEFEKHLRFLSGGLRGVARATRSPAAGKWDILAQMLEVGINDGSRVVTY
ncbi:Spindle pole body component [Coniochaeta hoffmannii]|uniref:Spindle pole body component n=1 Tax=Coniochaeta hoffmannii TaxID=91930 RepID=A0AA38RVK1_9PEZI|nr:Spindle pole body component [Coniochaeta hoffmannii]